jgi:hypothetical protein
MTDAGSSLPAQRSTRGVQNAIPTGSSATIIVPGGRTHAGTETPAGDGGNPDVVRADASTGAGVATAEVTKSCLEIVDKCRAGTLDEASAFLELAITIPNAGEHDAAYTSAFRTYCEIIESFNRFRDRARSQTLGGDGATGGGDEEDAGRRTNADVAEEDFGRATKQPHLDILDPDEDNGPRKRIDVGLLPWLARGNEGRSRVDPSSRKTQSLLQNFAIDLRFTKDSILNSIDCPQFPESEWTNLISGRSVNLDHVLSGLFSVSQETRKTERVGDMEIGRLLQPKLSNSIGSGSRHGNLQSRQPSSSSSIARKKSGATESTSGSSSLPQAQKTTTELSHLTKPSE